MKASYGLGGVFFELRQLLLPELGEVDDRAQDAANALWGGLDEVLHAEVVNPHNRHELEPLKTKGTKL